GRLVMRDQERTRPASVSGACSKTEPGRDKKAKSQACEIHTWLHLATRSGGQLAGDLAPHSPLDRKGAAQQALRVLQCGLLRPVALGVVRVELTVAVHVPGCDQFGIHGAHRVDEIGDPLRIQFGIEQGGPPLGEVFQSGVQLIGVREPGAVHFDTSRGSPSARSITLPTWQLYSGRHGCPAWKYGRASSCALRWMFAISLPHLRRSSASRLRASARPPCRRCAEVISSMAFSSGGIFSMTFFSFSEPLSPLMLPHALRVFRKMKNAAGLCTLRRSAALPETWGSPWFRTSVGPLSAERDKKYPAGLILAALDADIVGFCHRPVVE